MNTVSLEREQEVANLNRKLQTMIGLNRTLADERAGLMKKVQDLVRKLFNFLSSQIRTHVQCAQCSSMLNPPKRFG